jgi:glutaredoxin
MVGFVQGETAATETTKDSKKKEDGRIDMNADITTTEVQAGSRFASSERRCCARSSSTRMSVQYRWRSFSRTCSYCSLDTRTMTKLSVALAELKPVRESAAPELGQYQEFTSGLLQPGP